MMWYSCGFLLVILALGDARLPESCDDKCLVMSKQCALSCHFDLTNLSFVTELKHWNPWNELTFFLNTLPTIQKNAFNVPAFAHVERLHLNFNEIEHVEVDAFRGLTNLSSLNLGNNNLTIIKNDNFRGLDNLRTLTLSSNQIATIEVNALNGLGQLKHLELSGNQLLAVQPEIFSKVPVLFSLAIAKNRLTVVEEPTNGWNLEHLFSLDLSSNRLSAINSRALIGLDELFNLNLRGNQLTELHVDSFVANRQLIKLDLSDNPLKQAPILNSSLTHLVLSNCGLSGVPDNLLWLLPDIEELDLSSNQIASLPEGLFKQSANIKGISLNENKLKTILPVTFEEILPVVRESSKKSLLYALKLSNNPWDCTRGSSLKTLLDWCNAKSLKIELICETPKNLKGNSWLNAWSA